MSRIDDIKAWSILLHVKGLGNITLATLLQTLKSPQAIISADKKMLKQLGLSTTIIQQIGDISTKESAMVTWLGQAEDRHLITILDDDYPALLKKIYNPPVVLFGIGNRQVLSKHHFAIVGSRNPTTGGRKIAEQFAQELTNYGLNIVSGMATGIDYHSHLGALSMAQTIAVLGNGLDHVYPKKHKKIAQQISEKGLLLSEYQPDIQPKPQHFPQRNRIISGMSVGVLVVEAAKQSGSLITARLAMEEGREVFAVPSSIYNPMSRGTHALIKQGAKLVESIEDITVELTSYIIDNKLSPVGSQPTQIYEGMDENYKKLLTAMGYESVTVDQLVNTTDLMPDSISSMLTVLELQGAIQSLDGGYYTRVA